MYGFHANKIDQISSIHSIHKYYLYKQGNAVQSILYHNIVVKKKKIKKKM